MEKLLPIKFFEKRIRDEQRTEGGGSQREDSWILHGDALTHRSQQLVSNMSQVAASFTTRKQEKRKLPMVVATTIVEDAIAKSHRGQVIDLLDSDRKSNVIGIASAVQLDESSNVPNPAEDDKELSKPKETRRLLSVVTTDELILRIEHTLRDTQNFAKLISTIAEIEPFEAQRIDYNPDNRLYRIRLIDYRDSNTNTLAQNMFKAKCHTHGIKIERETRYTTDMNLYRVSLDSLTDLETVLGFEGIFSIEEAIPIRMDMDSLDDILVPTAKQPVEGETYPVVGVLDSGIEKNKYLSPWIFRAGEEYYEGQYQDRGHGTMVASVLEYSDELNGTDNAAATGVMMMDAVIVPDLRKEAVYPEDIIDNVRDAIERHRDIKIWTMSVGTVEECAKKSFSQYGIALDNIADENNVLIIKSAGNSNAFLHGDEHERITKMADSVRALVVGSIAGEKGQYDLAEIDTPSPFTRCGPGPAYVIKPDLVAYGGNAGKCPDGTVTTTGVRVLDRSGTVARAPGTSFSTPWIARIAAELKHLLAEDFDPLLIKALMVHNAGYPAGKCMNMEDKIKFMGFGMPPGIRDILYNSEHEITLILRDSLPKSQFINILEFPFPKSLVGDDGFYRGQITLTVVSAPLLRASEGEEYCQSDISVRFGTMTGIKRRDTSKPMILNPYGPENGANLLREDYYSKIILGVTEEKAFAKERTLLRYGKKFHPIKKYAIDLDEMTAGNRKKLLGKDCKWYMRIEMLCREAIEREFRETGEKLEQEFCVLLTIRDPEGKAPVYNEVTQQLQDRGFVYSDVKLKNEIREYVHIEKDSNTD